MLLSMSKDSMEKTVHRFKTAVAEMQINFKE